MIGPFEILFAFFLDLAVGDPQWIPHPVRFIGKAISGLERFLRLIFRSATGLRLAGVVLVLFIVLPVYFGTEVLVSAVLRASGRVSAVLGSIVVVYLAATTIAARELLRSAKRVIASVAEGDLEAARQGVSMIVGRDTQELSGKGVLKATIETLAENLSDGIVAPLFYLVIGGLPLAMAYKAVNTLDSMVGYKNPRYRYFGWAAARLDDIANFIPARISGLTIALAVLIAGLFTDRGKRLFPPGRSLSMMMRDGRKHPSPNSGVPEAAMAGALGVRLGGPSTYGGVVSDKPYIGDEEMDDYQAAADNAVILVQIASVLAASLATAASALGRMH